MLLFNLFEDSNPKDARAEFIRKTLGPKWHSLPGYQDFEAFLKEVAKVDPTKKGIYMPWIARLCISNPGINRTEDLARMSKDLTLFELNKPKIANKDINSYRSFGELYSAIEPFTVKQAPTNKEKQAEKMAKMKAEGITDVYAGPEGWIKIPTTVKAAQFLGQSTRWCTAARSRNMFKEYDSRDKLFVIFDRKGIWDPRSKPPKFQHRFQLHLDSGQFANEADSMVEGGFKSVPAWAKAPIVDWYQKHNPDLSLKHLLGLSSMGGQNLAKGTEHEGVFDLMKQYGVI